MIRSIILLSTLFALTACGNGRQRTTSSGEKVTTVNRTVEYDIYGTYTGTLPAADCPGIAVSLTLFEDGNYEQRSEYLGREVVYNEWGRFTVEADQLTLYPNEAEAANRYRIEENRLRMLDCDGKPITGKLSDHYLLTRTTKTK